MLYSNFLYSKIVFQKALSTHFPPPPPLGMRNNSESTCYLYKVQPELPPTRVLEVPRSRMYFRLFAKFALFHWNRVHH